MVRIVLNPGKEKAILAGHPWVFSGAVARSEGEEGAGAPCTVVSSSGSVLGHGYHNAHSSIRVRMLTRGDTPFASHDVRARLERALGARETVLGEGTTACRLVNSEGDFLPGLIVDKYGEGVCVQILTAGMEQYREAIISGLRSLLSPSFIYERSDTDSRKLERCESHNRLLLGEVPERLVAMENGLRFTVDVRGGQKTGMFLDQRDNRSLVRRHARGATVADCFAYTGGFSVYALAGGARRVRTVETSKKALEWARENRRLNGFTAAQEDMVSADVFAFLRETSERYSLLVLDPPKFAKHGRDVHGACRAYKDLNLMAIRRAEPQGIVFTFSCSQAVDAKLFRQVVFAAAADSGREVQVLQVLCQPLDHPVNIAHKEGDYLKGLVMRIL